MPNIQSIIYIAMVVMPILTGCTNAKEDQKQQKNQQPQEMVYPVEITNTSFVNNQQTLSSAGTIRFRRETSLGFTTSGKIADIRYNEGDTVKRGSLLASLDTTTVDADINVARAELDRTRSQYERISKLFEQGWVTKARLEQALASYTSAQARVEQANFVSDTAKLYAPSNGVIISRNIDKGQVISAGTTALIFGQLDSGYILRVPLSSSVVTKINVGMPVEVSISSSPDNIFSATVTEIDGRADERTGAFVAVVQLPSDKRFKSGQIAAANFIVTSDENNIIIPASAISGVRSSEAIVYVYNPDRGDVSIRNILLGEINDNMIHIKNGLSGGEQVIVRGHEKLKDGSKVQIVTRGLTQKATNKATNIVQSDSDRQ